MANMARYPTLVHDFRTADNGLLEKLRTGVALIAEVTGGFPYDAGIRENELKSVAPPFRPIDAVVFLFSGRKRRHDMTQCLWASRWRSGRLARFLLILDPLRSVHSILGGIYRRRVSSIPMIRLKLFLAPFIRRRHRAPRPKKYRQ